MSQPPASTRSLPFIVLLGLLTASFTTPAAAQWVTFGPDGGWVAHVVVDPQTPSILYAATEGGESSRAPTAAPAGG